MTARPVVDQEQAAWIQSGVVTIVLSSHGPSLMPSLAIGVGCRPAEQGSALRVFVLEAKAAQLLSDVRGGAAISVLFLQATTHRAIQLKASRAREVARTAADLATTDAYVDSMVVELAPLGESEAYVRATFARGHDSLVVLEITPAEAFDQTPGPTAGARLGGPQ